MKLKTNILLGALMVLLSLGLSAQETVSAETILNAIKDGKSITYNNVTVKGILDMTYMDEKLQDLPKRKRWYNGSNSIEQQIEGSISFVNCVFEEDVYAYYHDERSKYTFIANFEDNVVFRDCEFKGQALFKYSDFARNADFKGSSFNERSTFKYAEFKTYVSFANTVFDEDAVFKYTEFKKGVSFNSATFNDDLDIKYVDVKGEFDANNMTVKRDVDAKYANINGQSFTKYLMNSKN